MPVVSALAVRKAVMKSSFRLTEPTVIVGLPDSFFVQPARFMSEPSSGNSGSQKRRVEQWKQSTPASISGLRNLSSSAGEVASRAVKSCCFHCEKRSRIGNASPTASRTARVTSAAKLVRFSRLPPYLSPRWLVPSQKNSSMM